MFRPIRRKEKEISVDESLQVLKETRIGILALNGDDGYPFAIPVNYYYDEADCKIYFHGSKAGHKIDSLKRSDKVCFTVVGKEVVKKESWAPFVKSVVIFGRCHLIEDKTTADNKLRQFAMKYYPSEDLVNEEISVYGKAVQMYEIEIEHLSGKELQEK